MRGEKCSGVHTEENGSSGSGGIGRAHEDADFPVAGGDVGDGGPLEGFLPAPLFVHIIDRRVIAPLQLVVAVDVNVGAEVSQDSIESDHGIDRLPTVESLTGILTRIHPVGVRTAGDRTGAGGLVAIVGEGGGDHIDHVDLGGGSGNGREAVAVVHEEPKFPKAGLNVVDLRPGIHMPPARDMIDRDRVAGPAVLAVAVAVTLEFELWITEDFVDAEHGIHALAPVEHRATIAGVDPVRSTGRSRFIVAGGGVGVVVAVEDEALRGRLGRWSGSWLCRLWRGGDAGELTVVVPVDTETSHGHRRIILLETIADVDIEPQLPVTGNRQSDDRREE